MFCNTIISSCLAVKSLYKFKFSAEGLICFILIWAISFFWVIGLFWAQRWTDNPHRSIERPKHFNTTQKPSLTVQPDSTLTRKPLTSTTIVQADPVSYTGTTIVQADLVRWTVKSVLYNIIQMFTISSVWTVGWISNGPGNDWHIIKMWVT